VSFFDSSKCNGEVLGTDSQFGIAVLEVDKTGLIPVTKQENGQLKLGKHVFIVGNSLGISPAVSPGIINCIRTDGIIQLSANVPAGNAGGPLFDCRGRLVGLLDAQVTPMPDEIFTGWPNAFQQTVLAIPTERVYSCAEQIIRENSEPKGWFGATGEDMPPNNPRGVHIIKIAAGGPADRAGLQVGDLITGMNGYKVNQAIQMRDLVRQHKPGDSIQVNFSRGETKHSITLQLGNEKDHERPASGFSISSDIYSAPFPVKSSEVDLSNQLTVDPRISRRELIRRMNRMQRELDNLKVLIDQSR
jgi:S1-C subfamily serine protease